VYEDPTDLLRHIDEVAVANERGRYRGLFLPRPSAHYRKRAIEAECSRTAACFVSLSPMGSIRGREMMILPLRLIHRAS
jgi:hypothetical protein